ncbi:MAG TPA: EamA family transporter [Xanthobacteraceae bacterium]|nr:EamA family transporter [Xanthobacteraceae bacterium]
MTWLAFAVGIACQVCLVSGHIVLKHAMNATHRLPRRWGAIAAGIAAGIALLGLWFFLWLGLLRDFELSRVFPFEGIGPPLLVLGAAVFLKERIALRAWIGIALIAAGVALVAGS